MTNVLGGNFIKRRKKMTKLEPMKIGYEQYLFAQLWACKDDSFAELPYDEQWDLIPSKWREFEKSEFDEPKLLFVFDAVGVNDVGVL